MSDYRIKNEETFLYYTKPTDCWVCPGCETEIEMSAGSCFLCGCTKQTWLEQQEKAKRNAEVSTYKTSAPAKSSSSVMPRVITVIIIILLLLLLFYFVSEGAEPELETILTETEESLSVM